MERKGTRDVTLDIGDGCSIEVVPIPTGNYRMGVAPSGSLLLGGSVALLGCLALVLLIKKARTAPSGEKRFQYSLSGLIAFCIALGLLHWGSFLLWRGWNWRPCDEERPDHYVTLTTPIWMGKHEVTWKQFKALSDIDWGSQHDTCPATVCWEDAREFCEILSKKLHRTVRLPSEAEWEFACRGGVFSEEYYPPAADAVLDDIAWHKGNSGGFPHPVGGKQPNAFGLYDMQGNVWEWVEDDWHSSYQGAPCNGSEWVDRPRGEERVIRGGAFDYPTWFCRRTSRSHIGAFQSYEIGFRVVIE